MSKNGFDRHELEIGTQVEMEHTDDPKIAEKIAKDHLREDPHYYTHLEQCGMLHNGFVPNFRLEDWRRSGDLRWYHGTGRAYGEKILKDGFVRPREAGDYSKYSKGEDDELLPIPGRSYVSSSPGVALKYAIDGMLFEPGGHDKFCYVFEVALDPEVDVLIDEDLVAEDRSVFQEIAEHFYSKGETYGFEGSDPTVVAKKFTQRIGDKLAIDLTERIHRSKGYVNLAVDGPLLVVKAWKYTRSEHDHHIGVEGAESRFLKYAKEVELDMKKNGSEYFVWVVDDDGNYIDSEGVSGPHELKNAKAFARIAAQNGKFARVVSRGFSPLSKTFEVIDYYKPGKR